MEDAKAAAWSRGVLETNGIRISFARTGGAKPSLVMLHGLIGSGAAWAPVARVLEADFDVIMPDARGHGDSSAPEHGYRSEDFADDVVVLIRGLGLERPVLLGHSMGGMTAAVVASRNADLLRGLVLVDPTFLSPERQRDVHASDVAGDHRRMLELSRADLIAQGRTRHPKRALEIVELQAEARLKTSLAAFDVLTPPNPDYSDVVSAITVPTLLVVGDNGNVVTLVMAADLRAINDRVRCVQIENAGHGLPFERPERLGEIVRDYARELR